MRLPNIPRRGRGDRKSRGQSLVEFALVLPLILMLTLIALDFGRVYLGWINLQSMARIGANLAANNPTAWSGSGDAAIKARYQAQIKNDATANNCRLPVVGGVQTAPAPTFTGQDLGDEAHVALTCTFGIITPGISNILGGSVAVSSSAVFPVKTGMTVTDNTAGGSPPNAAFTGNGDVAPSSLSGPAPFNVVFRDTSGGQPDELAVGLQRRFPQLDLAGSTRPRVHGSRHLPRDVDGDELRSARARRRWASRSPRSPRWTSRPIRTAARRP